MAVLLGGPARAQDGPSADRIPTPAEAADYLAFTVSPSAMGYLGTLANRHAVRLDTIASLEREAAGARVIVSVSFDAPAGAAADRPIVLVLAGQHGDERAGVDAALILAGDLASGALDPLLERLDIRIVPIANPWGLDHGVRHNEDDLDLNRDHLRLRTRSIGALHETFGGRVHAVLDLHELGPVVYDVETGAPTHPNVDPALVEFARFYLTPYVARGLGAAGFTYHEYLVQEPPVEAFVEGTAPGADSEVFVTYAPIAANNARNVFALGGAVALLVEVASTRDVEGYRERTDAMVLAVRGYLEAIATQVGELRARVAAARSSVPDTLVLRARNVADPDMPRLHLRVRSQYGTPMNGTIGDWRPDVEPTHVIATPAAYLLDASQEALAALLARHGIRVERQGPARAPDLSSYVGTVPDPDGAPGTVDGALRQSVRSVDPGAFLVRVDQAGARLLATIVEPWSQDGWFAEVAEAGDPAVEYPVRRMEGSIP